MRVWTSAQFASPRYTSTLNGPGQGAPASAWRGSLRVACCAASVPGGRRVVKATELPCMGVDAPSGGSAWCHVARPIGQQHRWFLRGGASAASSGPSCLPCMPERILHSCSVEFTAAPVGPWGLAAASVDLDVRNSNSCMLLVVPLFWVQMSLSVAFNLRFISLLSDLQNI